MSKTLQMNELVKTAKDLDCSLAKDNYYEIKWLGVIPLSLGNQQYPGRGKYVGKYLGLYSTVEAGPILLFEILSSEGVYTHTKTPYISQMTYKHGEYWTIKPLVH